MTIDRLGPRRPYEPEHRDFAESFRRFLVKEVLPFAEEWERDGIVPHDLFAKAGAHGFLAMEADPCFGGAGVTDFRFNAVLNEELYRANLAGVATGLILHNDICLPYFLKYASDQQRHRWLPGIVSGTLVTAIAMTEPGTGSDLAGIATRAVRDGDEYVVDGSKTFITNGTNADLIVTVARTGPERHEGLSLLVIERGMAGFARGRNLEKIGLHAADTSELSFAGVRVPLANLLGREGHGFTALTDNLPRERLSIAITAIAASRAALNMAVGYVTERAAFGRRVGGFQHTRFVLAELATEIALGEAFVDRCIEAYNLGTLSAVDAAMAKWWSSELQGKVVDRCLQLHGGYGYMLEYPIARAYQDARATRIYGGTTEIMKEIVGRAILPSMKTAPRGQQTPRGRAESLEEPTERRDRLPGHSLH
jgi:alkylation response protein AidB-like acyl-CoA dehydrogenase